MSKGSTRRKRQITAGQETQNWDAIFNKTPDMGFYATPKPPEDNPDFRMSPDICSVCGETLIDGLCPKMLEQQKERTQ